MPSTHIYLTEKDLEVWKKAKQLIKKLNAEKRLNLSLSAILMQFLREFIKKIEENPDTGLSDKIRVEIGSMEISANGPINFRPGPRRGPGETKLTTLLLEEKIRSWSQEILRIADEFSKGRATKAMLQRLQRIEKEIFHDIKVVKTAPEDLADKLAVLMVDLRRLKEEISNSMTYFT